MLEAVIYIAILVMVVVSVIFLLVSMLRHLSEIKANHALALSAQSGMERLVREIRAAESIDSNQSIFDASPGRLVLNSLDEVGDDVVYDFYTLDGKLMLAIDGGAGFGLLPDPVVLTDLEFNHFTGTTTGGVKINLTVSDPRGTVDRTFYSTAILR